MFKKCVLIEKHGEGLTTATTHRQLRAGLILILASSLAAVISASATASQGSARTGSALKACGYMTSTAGGSSIENIKFSDARASGAKGTFVFEGTNVRETKHLSFAKNGLAFTSFAVAMPGTEMIKVSVPTKPATVATFHFTLKPTTGDVASKVGCTPR